MPVLHEKVHTVWPACLRNLYPGHACIGEQVEPRAPRRGWLRACSARTVSTHATPANVDDPVQALAPQSARGTGASPDRDIAGREDIEVVLRDFYGQAFADALLGPVFVDIAQMNLDEHLPAMCDFWQTALFHAGLYRRNALAPHQLLHRKAQLTQRHFGRWLTLWRATVRERHHGPKADLAVLQATRIAATMSRRITGPANIGQC
jgi:hemoglobin